MKVKRLNLEIGKMLVVVRFWDKGEHHFITTNSSYRDAAYITKDNRIRFIDTESSNGEIRAVKEDFEEISKKFFGGDLERLTVDAMRNLLNDLQLINSVKLDHSNGKTNVIQTRSYFPENGKWFLEEGRGSYEYRLRNLQISIFGITQSSYHFWAPGGGNLFEELDEYVDIPESKFVPVVQRYRQLELNFEEA